MIDSPTTNIHRGVLVQVRDWSDRSDNSITTIIIIIINVAKSIKRTAVTSDLRRITAAEKVLAV